MDELDKSDLEERLRKTRLKRAARMNIDTLVFSGSIMGGGGLGFLGMDYAAVPSIVKLVYSAFYIPFLLFSIFISYEVIKHDYDYLSGKDEDSIV